MKLPAFLKKITISKPKTTGTLVPRAHVIWRASIAFLVLALTAMLAFDGYVFFFKVQALEREAIETQSIESNIPDIKKQVFSDARALLERRSRAAAGAGQNLPARNPFGQ